MLPSISSLSASQGLPPCDPKAMRLLLYEVFLASAPIRFRPHPQLKQTMRKQRAKRKLSHAIEHLQEHIGKHAPLIITGGRIVLPKLSPDEEAATILARKMCELLEDRRSFRRGARGSSRRSRRNVVMAMASK